MLLSFAKSLTHLDVIEDSSRRNIFHVIVNIYLFRSFTATLCAALPSRDGFLLWLIPRFLLLRSLRYIDYKEA